MSLFFPLTSEADVGVGAVRVFDQQLIHIKPEWHRADLPTFQFAPNLMQCMRKFDAYVYAQFTQKNKSFCFVTDGPGDLVYWLRKECLLKGIRLAAYCDRFFDLNKEFSRFYPEYNGKTVADMAQIVGVPRKPESSGIENCKIISNIIASMLREGFSFLEPETIPIAFDPFAVPQHTSLFGTDLPKALSYKGAVAGQRAPAPVAPGSRLTVGMHSASPPLSNGGGGGGGGIEEAVGGEDDDNSPVVRLRGLPWDATDAQVFDFFAGLRVVGVVWTFTHRNRPSGEAFVTFASVGEAVKALAMHKQVLGKRYIEVFASTVAQAETAQQHAVKKDSANPSPAMTPSPGIPGGAQPAAKREAGDLCVMMYGLPYTVTVDEVEQFFEGYNIVLGSVEIDTDSAGRAIGTGQVTFHKAKDAARALAELNKQFIGKRYVNLHQNPQRRKQQQQQLLQQKS